MNRYPLSMHKGEWPSIKSQYVYDEEGEQRLAAEGYSTVAPWIPDDLIEGRKPAAVPVNDLEPALASLAERVAVLEIELEELKAKRGPGRPPKEPK